MTRIFLIAALVLGAGAAQADPAMTATTAKGPTLVNSKGMTLYTFAKDPAGKSVCNGGCAANWPPFKADYNAQPSGEWTIIQRDDGTKQWAYDGKPLYTWVQDKKPGDVTGDGYLNGAWKVAKP